MRGRSVRLCTLATAALLVLATSVYAADKPLPVIVVVDRPEQVKSPDGFIDPPKNAPAALNDSARDIATHVNSVWAKQVKMAKKPEDARIVLHVTGREQSPEQYVVRVKAVYGDHPFELVGSSTAQWKLAAQRIVEQLCEWVDANRAKLSEP